MTTRPEAAPFGIVAGSGKYPLLMLQGAKKEGRRVIGVGFKGAQNKAFVAACDEYASYRIGAVDGPIAFMQKHGVSEVVLTGQIKPSCIYTMWPDPSARRLLSELDRRNAHSIFGRLCTYILSHGITILPSTTYLQEYLPAAGHVAGPPLREDLLKDAREGMERARDIAQLDIGQSIIYHQGEVLCVEGFKGTNECIQSGGYRDFSPILCKITKPEHDMRFDVPCIGIGTIRNCLKAGIKNIVLEADKCMILQENEVHAACEKYQISIHAMKYPEGGSVLSYGEHPESDVEHAQMLAEELEKRGIGDCAVVCDGVVIVVGDVEGARKCLIRAGAYMKRLRWVRIFNWLAGLILGRGVAAPAAVVMSCRGTVDAELRELARRSRITLIE